MRARTLFLGVCTFKIMPDTFHHVSYWCIQKFLCLEVKDRSVLEVRELATYPRGGWLKIPISSVRELLTLSSDRTSHNILNFCVISLSIMQDLWLGIFDFTILIVLVFHKPHHTRRANLTDKHYLWSYVTHTLTIPVSFCLSIPLCPLKHNNIEIRPINNAEMASSYSSGRESHICNGKSKA